MAQNYWQNFFKKLKNILLFNKYQSKKYKKKSLLSAGSERTRQ